ncbi:ferric reductase [Scheffersomyces xylosifermentans]|uniref:ferric reductase n=1 Tax=Scheffersomyces xylosifermentans TaxID=1304137 RepID=UPI00315D0C25
MVSLKQAAIATAFCLSFANAEVAFHIYHESEFAVMACTALVGKTALYFSKTDKIKYCNVHNQPALGTYAHCIEQIPYKDARKNFLDSCAPFNLTEEQYLAAYNNATKYLTNTTADPTFNKKKIYNKPAILSPKKIVGAWKSEKGRWTNYNYAHYFGMVLMAYWYLVMFVAGLCNLTYFIAPNAVNSLTGGVVNAFRKYITLPATFNKSHAHHKQIFHYLLFLIPSRLETILVSGWIIMAIIFSAVKYTHDTPNVIWPQGASTEVGRKIADRTGLIVGWIVPTLVLFAGRNNFMQWLSGWSYSRFVLIHKWMSRIAFLLSITHGVGMTFNGKGLGKYETRNSKPYVRWGYVAIVCMAIMTVQSLMVFRRSNYELFLACHIILAVFFIAGGWIHTRNDGYHQWYICATAVWAFDRAVRLARLAFFGLRTAEVRLVANETLKVTVTRPAYWKPFPGCHAFIHFVRPTCFWQSHPFTIVDSVAETNTITFYIKVKGGVTHGLYQYLSKQPDNKANIKVTIEGPYGQRQAIQKYENAVFLAGGNGIPGLYYEATDIAKRSEKTNVKFYWVIRHYRSIEWFYTELCKFKNTNITPIIYVTQPHVGLTSPFISDNLNSSDEEEEEQEKKSDVAEESGEYIAALKKNLSFIEFREGRPDFYQIVAEEIKEANGPIGFASCAHGSMVDDARRSVADHLGDSKYRVELFEQIQAW